MEYKDYTFHADGGYTVDGVFYTFEQVLEMILKDNEDVLIRLKERE